MRQRRGIKSSRSLGRAHLHAHAEEEASRSVRQEQPAIIVQIANPTAFDGQGSIIMLELGDEASAKRVALRIAHETGRRVTVRSADMTVIQTIPAAKIH
jgi:hypothetical protein